MSNLNNKFNEVHLEFVKEIKDLDLENEDSIIKNENNTVNNISLYFENCNKLGKDFYEKNAIIFDKNLVLIDNISLYQLWNSEITDLTRDQIWKYLFTLYLYSYSICEKINIGDLLKKFKGINFDMVDNKDIMIYSVIDNLNSTKRINKLIKHETKKLNNKHNTNSLLDNLGNLGNLNLGEGLINGEIGKLAKEIASEINPDTFQKDLEDKDPKELLNSLFTGNLDNNSPIMGLVNTISGKIQEKINKGSINENILFNEAQDILGSSNKMGNLNKKNLNQRKNKVRNKIKLRQNLNN